MLNLKFLRLLAFVLFLAGCGHPFGDGIWNHPHDHHFNVKVINYSNTAKAIHIEVYEDQADARCEPRHQEAEGSIPANSTRSFEPALPCIHDGVKGTVQVDEISFFQTADSSITIECEDRADGPTCICASANCY